MGYFEETREARIDQQFLAGGSFRNWLKLLRANSGVDAKYLTRALYVSTISLLGIPFRIYEKAKFHTAIADTSIHPAPIFIIGHWRSGTTYVHQLLAQNPHFAFVTFTQTMIPGMFLTENIFKAIVKASMPDMRPMDNVELNPHSPEEEEYALGNLGPYSFYHALSFPKKFRDIFDKYVLFEDIDARTVDEWKSLYLHFLRKISIAANGKRIILKNPANTGRIRILLDLFPDAKFIHVVRDPYVTYCSTMHWLNKELELEALQNVDRATMRESVMINYEKLLKRYLQERQLIPRGNLVEVKFEEFENDPIGGIERIYSELGFELDLETRALVGEFVSSVAGYKKNTYHLDQESIQELASRWGFAIREWEYDLEYQGQLKSEASPTAKTQSYPSAVPFQEQYSSTIR
jgi:hypothetical protein